MDGSVIIVYLCGVAVDEWMGPLCSGLETRESEGRKNHRVKKQ
jgi:hypothetical protein